VRTSRDVSHTRKKYENSTEKYDSETRVRKKSVEQEEKKMMAQKYKVFHE
jgi:hypothetical protein